MSFILVNKRKILIFFLVHLIYVHVQAYVLVHVGTQNLNMLTRSDVSVVQVDGVVVWYSPDE